MKFDLLPSDLDHSRAELYTNGQIVDLLEALVGKLKQQTRFSHAGVANDNILEEIGVRGARGDLAAACGCRGHCSVAGGRREGFLI